MFKSLARKRFEGLLPKLTDVQAFSLAYEMLLASLQYANKECRRGLQEILPEMKKLRDKLNIEFSDAAYPWLQPTDRMLEHIEKEIAGAKKQAMWAFLADKLVPVSCHLYYPEEAKLENLREAGKSSREITRRMWNLTRRKDKLWDMQDVIGEGIPTVPAYKKIARYIWREEYGLNGEKVLKAINKWAEKNLKTE